MRRHVVLAVALLLIASLVTSLLPCPVQAQSWLTGWQYRKKITIDQTKVDADLTDFPVLVKLTSTNFTFSKARSDGYDIRFTSSDGTTLLKYERERHDNANSLAEYWVKIPSVSGTNNTDFYIYYGKSDAADGADPTNVWDSNHKAAWHLKENPAGTAPQAQDSTTNNNDGTSYGTMTASDLVDGKVGKAWDFDGTDDYVRIPDSASFDNSGKITLEAMIKPASGTLNNNAHRFISTQGDPGVVWYARINQNKLQGGFGDSNNIILEVSGTTTLTSNTWYYSVVVLDSNKISVYLNGALENFNTFSPTGNFNPIDTLNIGLYKANEEVFSGVIDEVRISNTARSAAWIKASYNSGNNSLVSYGSEEAWVAPTVTTVWCTGFDRTWAIVNGTIAASGYPTAITQIGFDYGLTSSYGLSWTESGTYTAGQSFNAVLTGLSPATVYHFRAKAYNGAWGYGDDRVFSTEGSPTLYEEHNTGGDADSSAIYGANCAYQTFTTNTTSIAHTVTSIKLMLKKTGSPGTVTVSIKHSSGGVPTGADLVTSTLNGNTFETGYTWYEFVTTETGLEANTTYAIVVRALAGDASNYVSWQKQATGTYAGGNAGYSTDSGSTWTSVASADQLFEIWGNPCLEMEDAKVISGYLNTGDWLITCLYKNIYPPYYTDGTDVSSVFYLQLVDGSTVKAQTKVAAWGYKPGSIYLSADMVAGLEWGKAYKVRIWGDFGSNPYMEYSLQSADWLGSALIRLDSWVRSAAVLMEQYYGTPLTVYIADRGLCLNSEGGVTFIAGIPELSSVRPALFQTVIQQLTYTPPEYTQDYQDELVWQTAIGSQLAAMFTEAGNIFSLDGATVGAIIAFIFYAVIAALAFAPGHAIAAIVLPIPFLLAAWYIGFIALVVMGVVCSVAALLLVWQMWWKQG